MENLPIHCNPLVLLFTFLVPKAKELDSQTGSKRRLSQTEKESFGAGFDYMPKDQRGLLASYFVCVRGHTAYLGLAHRGEETAALSKLQEAAPAGGLGRPTSPSSAVGSCSSPPPNPSCPRAANLHQVQELLKTRPGILLASAVQAQGNHRLLGKKALYLPGKPRKIPGLGKNIQEPLHHICVSWNQPKLASASDLCNYPPTVHLRFKGQAFQK